jgi:hypothetical protein
VGAVSAGKRTTLAKALERYNRLVDADNYKHEASDLAKWKYVNSQSSRGGGYWLTVQGKQIAERLRNE